MDDGLFPRTDAGRDEDGSPFAAGHKAIGFLPDVLGRGASVHEDLQLLGSFQEEKVAHRGVFLFADAQVLTNAEEVGLHTLYAQALGVVVDVVVESLKLALVHSLIHIDAVYSSRCEITKFLLYYDYNSNK